MNLAKIDAYLVMALTEYDRKQSTKKHYNPYALGIYFQALNEWRKNPKTKIDPLGTLPDYFTTLRDEREWFHITTINGAIKKIKEQNLHI